MNDRDQMEAEEREERLRDAAPKMLDVLKALAKLPYFLPQGSAMRNWVQDVIAEAEGREP